MMNMAVALYINGKWYQAVVAVPPNEQPIQVTGAKCEVFPALLQSVSEVAYSGGSQSIN